MDTEFDGGVYHGRIILPAEYPMKPPNIIILTVSQWSLIIVVCDVCNMRNEDFCTWDIWI